MGVGIAYAQASLHIRSSINDKIRLGGTQSAPHTIFLEGTQGLRFWDDNHGELMRITEVGNVGIGTNPQAKLHILFGDSTTEKNLTLERHENSPYGVAIVQKKARGTKGSPAAVQNNDTIGGITAQAYDGSAYVEAARIRTSVDGTPSSGIVPGRIEFLTRDSSGNNLERMRITSSGNVGIGTTTPSEKLTVAGNVLADAYYYISDKRLKKDIHTLDGLSLILKLRGVEFKWKKDGSKSMGLIAQEVEKVAPSLVKTDKNTGLKSVLYGNLVAPLIEAVKEIYSEIIKIKQIISDIIFRQDRQEEEIKALKEELKRQKEELQELRLKLQSQNAGGK